MSEKEGGAMNRAPSIEEWKALSEGDLEERVRAPLSDMNAVDTLALIDREWNLTDKEFLFCVYALGIETERRMMNQYSGGLSEAIRTLVVARIAAEREGGNK